MKEKEVPPVIDIPNLTTEFKGKRPEEVISWALSSFGKRVAVCTSFQAEGMVIVDMAHRIDPEVRVFTIDTGRLPPETYELMDQVRQRYGIAVEVHCPDHEELSQMLSRHGVNPFYRSVSLRLMCCEIRKVNPLNRVLRGLDAWITGVRRDQLATRAGAQKVELDTAHGGIFKVNPLADWTAAQVWDYIRANDVPYNKLYDQGYSSIGCAPCTRPVQPGEDPRAGRWWWELGIPKECGMHVDPLKRVQRSPAGLEAVGQRARSTGKSSG